MESPASSAPPDVAAAEPDHHHADHADDHRAEVVADTPVIDCAMLRNRRWAPLVKTISSRFSAV